ncbi:mitochondrial carrier protein [Skeletonema marinoi]|uniref:Mitochondrial carrier protein n=1 Tax=Skeletonema marinoi TaxID=267567 RepID=A0AAD8YI19_9STRA|nr:mitochondrial carrier protein [Skeletonema marinoi]
MESSDEPSSLPPQQQSSSLLHDVLGSATAGIISRIMTHPLDTVKARLQAPSSSFATYRGPIDALIQTYRNEGIRSLYGGFGAVIVGGTPGTVLYLTGYAFFRDTFSSLASNSNGNNGGSTFNSSNKPTLTQGQEFAVHFSSGILAEAVTCIIYVPVDVVKERMQVQSKSRESLISNKDSLRKPQSYHYNGSWDALQQIIRTEGMKGIYRGYWATLASFGPFSALYFVFYERCKVWSKEMLQDNKTDNSDAQRMDDGDLPLHYLVACSTGAGALASWLTSPLDMAKLRLQVQRGQTAAASNTGQNTIYRGMFDCLHSAFKKGELFRGAGARVLHFAPATTVTMTAYEKCRSFYADTLR